MSENFDGQWELRWFYTCTPAGFLPLQHRHTFDVAMIGAPIPGANFNTISLEQKDGEPIGLVEFIEAYQLLLRPLYSPLGTINRVELWQYPAEGYDSTFIGQEDIGEVGTAGAPIIPAAQTTLTFRTQLGGVARCQLMETYDGNQSRVSPPYANGDFAAISNYWKSAESPIVGRDNAYIIGNINWCSGQNEKLARKRFRS